MLTNNIDRLISEGEHDTQDFKLRIDSSKKIAVTLSAFANTFGGKLLVGVKDNGKVNGVKSVEEEFHMLEAAATLYCKPNIALKPEVYMHSGKQLLIVDIQKSNAPVLAFNTEDIWRAYMRVQDENFMINRVILLSKELNSKKSEKFELTENHFNFLKTANDREEFGFHFAQRKLKCSPRETELTLAQLIRWDIIGFILKGSKTSYFVKQIPENSD